MTKEEKGEISQRSMSCWRKDGMGVERAKSERQGEKARRREETCRAADLPCVVVSQRCGS
jgi:hypothetical protein